MMKHTTKLSVFTIVAALGLSACASSTTHAKTHTTLPPHKAPAQTTGYQRDGVMSKYVCPKLLSQPQTYTATGPQGQTKQLQNWTCTTVGNPYMQVFYKFWETVDATWAHPFKPGVTDAQITKIVDGVVSAQATSGNNAGQCTAGLQPGQPIPPSCMQQLSSGGANNTSLYTQLYNAVAPYWSSSVQILSDMWYPGTPALYPIATLVAPILLLIAQGNVPQGNNVEWPAPPTMALYWTKADGTPYPPKSQSFMWAYGPTQSSSFGLPGITSQNVASIDNPPAIANIVGCAYTPTGGLFGGASGNAVSLLSATPYIGIAGYSAVGTTEATENGQIRVTGFDEVSVSSSDAATPQQSVCGISAYSAGFQPVS